jgi:hypothetical protein
MLKLEWTLTLSLRRLTVNIAIEYPDAITVGYNYTFYEPSHRLIGQISTNCFVFKAYI